MTRSNFIVGTSYWLVLTIFAGHVPQRFDGSAQRAHWAHSLDYNGNPDGDGSDAILFVAVGWRNEVLVIVPSEGTDPVIGQSAVDEILASPAFVQKLIAHGFKKIRCNGIERTLRNPEKQMPRPTPRRNGLEVNV
jgi:hypothetical protein